MTKRHTIFYCVPFVLLTSFLLACASTAGEPDIWLVDSKCACGNPSVDTLHYYRLVDHRWEHSDAETFYATQVSEVPLVIYSPGYTTTMADTVEIGMKLTSLYVRKSPNRTVFWKWPSEKTGCRLVPDIRSKISTAAHNALFLAEFLRGLAPESKVCLVGFSFGNRIILDAAAHLAMNPSGGLKLHLVLAGAATDQGSLGVGGRHGMVPGFCDKILILYNPADSKLKFYRFLYGKHARPESLGRLGPPMSRILPQDRNRIEAININRYVGKEHQTIRHIMTPSFRNRIDTYLLFQ